MVRISDIDQSLDFYTNLLGMQVLRKSDFPEWGISKFEPLPMHIIPVTDLHSRTSGITIDTGHDGELLEQLAELAIVWQEIGDLTVLA